MTKIMFIDSNSSNLKHCQAALDKGISDCKIIVAENTKDGIKKSHENPDIIILDSINGNVDSFDICNILKSDKKLCNIPLLILANSEDLEKLNDHSLDCNADVILKKPIVVTEFVSVIRLLIKLGASLNQNKSLEYQLQKERDRFSSINHRVKNNMQIINSMLNLQAKFTRDNYDKILFEDSQNRVRAISLVHDNLQKANHHDSINFAEYTNKLIYQLHLTYRLNRKIKVKSVCENVIFPVSVAIPVGLLINEILADILKKFKHLNIVGNILVKLGRQSQGYYLRITSDPIPNIDLFNYELSRDFTSMLIKTLVSQLHGKIKFKGGNAPEWDMIFKEIKVSYPDL